MLVLPKGTIKNSFDKYFTYVLPEYLPVIKEKITQGIANPGESLSVSYLILKGNGELAWFESTGRLFLNNHKFQMFGITVDITEQKKIQNRLNESENLLRQSQKVAKIGSYILDVNTGIWKSSSYLDELFGIDSNFEKNVSGWLQIVHPDDREMMREYLQTKVLTKLENFNKEYRIKNSSTGKTIWVHGMGEREFDKNGKPVKMIGTIQDINYRIKTDDLLKESESRYHDLLNNLPVGISRSTIGGEVISANPAMAEMYGYDSVEELLQVPAKNYYSTETPREIMLNKLMENGQLLEYETKEYKKDGSLIWVSANYKLVTTKKQNETYIDGVLIDITERKRIEKAIRQKDIEFRKLSANLPDLIFQFTRKPDGSYCVPIASEGIKNIFGCNPEDVVDDFTPIAKVIHPDDAKRVIQEIEYSAKHLSYFTCEFRVIIPGKGMQWIYSRSTPEKLSDGSVTWYGFNMNITERKIIEDAVRISEDKFRGIAEQTSDLISLTDEKGTITYASPAVKLLFGYTSEEMTGRNFIDFLDEKEIPKAFERFSKTLLKGEKTRELELLMKRKDGSLFFGELNGSVFYSGNQYGTIVVIRDISERKAAELELRNKERLLTKITDNFPNSYISIIEKDLTIGFSAGQEFIKQKLDPKLFTGLTLNQVFGDKAGIVRNHYEKKCNEEESNFELCINNQNQKNKTGPLYSDNNEIDRILVVTENITEQKEKEAELLRIKEEEAKSRERYELAMMVTLDGPYDWDLITNEIYYSPRWKEILGYKPHELPNEFSIWEKLTKPSDVKKSWEMLNKHIAGELDKFEMEFKMLHKDGHWVDILSRAIAHFDENGKAIRVVGTHIDISEAKIAEKLLKENEERFRKLIEHMPSGVAIYQPINNGADFKFIEINKRAEIITNSKRKKIIGNTLLEKFPKMKDSPLYGALQNVYKTGKDEYIPSFYYKDSVREGWRENHIYKLPTGEIVAIFNDTTELKEAENTLKSQNEELVKAKLVAQQNEYRFKALHDASFGGIAIHDFGIILDCNHGLSLLSGYSHEELIGSNGVDLLIAQQSREEVFKQIKSEYEKPYEVFGIRKNGEEYPVRLQAKMIPYKNKTVRVVEFRDITEIKKAEIELIKAKEKAEESDRLKSAFLANMSHEIRTPMNGILGFTSLLKEPGLTGEQQQSYIDIIQKSGDRMLNTVNDIIEISKIETGQVSVLLNELNINELLEFMVKFFTPEVQAKGMKLFFKNEVTRKDALINTDESKLTSVLTNLIKNAIKYSKKGSITLSCKKQGEHLFFAVEDTGIGIPENRKQAIFERFVQADIEDRHVHEGSGLGLAISKSYVEMLGGEIHVKSTENVGSIFSFTIKYIAVQSDSMVKKMNVLVNEGKDLDNIYMLVAEDDEVSYFLLENIFKHEKITLIWAKNGQDAIDTLKSHPEINLILMDIKMPGMDGIEATKKIREFNPTIPVIAQTAYALEGDKEKILAAGCNDYIAKPVDKKELMQKIIEFMA